MQVKFAPVKGRTTKTMAIITNGPQFIAQIHAVEVKAMRLLGRGAIQKAAEVVKEEWRGRIPSGARADGFYRESLRIATRSYDRPSTDRDFPIRDRMFKGVAARIYPGRTAGPDDDEQPYRYAGVLEYGGKLGDKQHRSYIPAQPSARPALDAKVGEVVDIFADAMRAAVSGPAI